MILTCGARRTPETDTRLDLIKNNVDVFKRAVPEIVKNCPKAILLVVTNPGKKKKNSKLFKLIYLIIPI